MGFVRKENFKSCKINWFGRGGGDRTQLPCDCLDSNQEVSFQTPVRAAQLWLRIVRLGAAQAPRRKFQPVRERARFE